MDSDQQQQHDADIIARARAILDAAGKDATCTGYDTADCPCRALALELARCRAAQQPYRSDGQPAEGTNEA